MNVGPGVEFSRVVAQRGKPQPRHLPDHLRASAARAGRDFVGPRSRLRRAGRGLLYSDQTRSGLCYTGCVVVRNISEAKAQLSALVEAVLKGDEVILAKAGKPVAKIVPYAGAARPRKPGALAGKIWIAADFDSLPDDIAEAFGMKEPRW